MNSAASQSPAEPSPANRVWEAGGHGFRYAAFLSYSHRDKAITAWLHAALERYRIPRQLVGTVGHWGPVPARLSPIFRDRDELPASGDLGAELTTAIAAARFLIVIASPASASSRWVNEEILAFKRRHGEARVLALVVDGEPNAADPAREALAPALRYHITADGCLSDRAAEPIAADMRAEADGRRLAFLKLVAGLTGLRLDSLARRDAQRRTRQLTLIAALSIAGMTFTSGLAFYAENQRREADRQRTIAERESETARAAAAYMVDTFRLASPATENPRTISAFEILRRSAERAETELAGQPEILVRIIDSLAWSYLNLGLYDEAEDILRRTRPAIDDLGAEGVYAMRPLAELYLRQGRPAYARTVVEAALRRIGHVQAGASAQVDTAAVRLLLTRARIERAEGHFGQALLTLDDALARMERSKLEIASDRAALLHTRGNVLLDEGQFAESEESLESAARIYAATVGRQHRLYGECLYDLAQSAYVAGKLATARERIDEALAILERVLDETSPFLAHALALKGQILYGERNLGGARAALEKAVAIYRRALDGPSYVIGISEVYLALIASEQGQTGTALAYLDKARANYDASYKAIHPNHGDLLVNRARILARAGRRSEALADCTAGLAILIDTLGEDHSFTVENQATCRALSG